MNGKIGVIRARGEADSAFTMTRVLGVPLVLWAVNNLRRALPIERIYVDTDRADIEALAAVHGVGALPRAGEGAPDSAHVLVHEAARPFCARTTIERAIREGADDAHAFADSPIEQLRVGVERDAELVEAVARGLAPGHPCVVGVRRLRLPLAKPIDAVVNDVDGVLTDGRIITDSAGAFTLAFHVHDGMGAQRLAQAGVKVGWLSVGAAEGAIRARAARLGVEHVDVGAGDKGDRFTRLCAQMGADPGRTIYLGDDVNDLPAMARAGLCACPADARPEVRATVDLILDTRGGAGAFRELAELLLDGARGCAGDAPLPPSEHGAGL